MTTDPPLLIATYDLFRDHRPHTLPTVSEKLHVSESAARKSLERLEEVDVLVRTRGGTEMPVWKRHPRAENDLFASLSVASGISERRRRRV
jgi:Mn-dependent DtxR family transcriptional regulator